LRVGIYGGVLKINKNVLNSSSMAERKETCEKHGVVFILFDGNKLQLEERMKPQDQYFGYTFIPGGKIEDGEEICSALRREVMEEYGVTLKEGFGLGDIQGVEDGGVLNVRHIFLVTSWDGTLANPEGKNRHIEATFSEARELCKHPVSQKILDLFEAKLFG